MNRKVLIHTRRLEIPGGKQTYLKAIDPHFKNEISYFYYGSPEPVKESFITFIRRFFGDYIRFYKTLQHEKYDLIHINTSLNPKSFFRDSIFSLISKNAGCKTLIYWHGWKWNFERKTVRRILPFFRFTFGKADAMICLAGDFVKSLKSYRYQKPVFLETTVVEDHIFNARSLNSDASGNKKTAQILFLSRVEDSKGIYETVDGFRMLLHNYPGATLCIAGTGTALQPLKNYVDKEKIPGIIFSGWIEGEEKIKSLVRANVFILASYSEGMPICILEAMAVGLPVVTTFVGGLKDFFEDGTMGYTVQLKDAEDIRDKLEKILGDRDLSKRQGTFNKQYALEKFSAEKVCNSLENIYEAIISNNTDYTNGV